MKPLIHRKARNGRSRKYCIILMASLLHEPTCLLYTLNSSCVPTYNLSRLCIINKSLNRYENRQFRNTEEIENLTPNTCILQV